MNERGASYSGGGRLGATARDEQPNHTHAGTAAAATTTNHRDRSAFMLIAPSAPLAQQALPHPALRVPGASALLRRDRAARSFPTDATCAPLLGPTHAAARAQCRMAWPPAHPHLRRLHGPSTPQAQAFPTQAKPISSTSIACATRARTPRPPSLGDRTSERSPIPCSPASCRPCTRTGCGRAPAQETTSRPTATSA